MRIGTFYLYAVGVFVVAVALQFIGLRVGARFRSAERKTGTYRAAGGQGTSSKLPMTGGPVMVLAALLAGWGAHRWLGGGSISLWPGLWKVAIAVAGFGVVGFLDDFGKYRGKGLSQKLKTIGCVLVAAVVAALLCTERGVPWTGWTAVRFVIETIFLFCFSVAADFSDGIDGLAGGLGAIGAFAMAVVALIAHRDGAPLWAIGFAVIFAFVLVNLPSAWTSRGTAVRRARAYLGDSGALAMGGGMAALALWMHLGWMFVPAVGVWILEGFSSGWQAEFLVKRVYRRFGRVERYGAAHAPHTEFPLPLLAAPAHHHFEVAGWDRLQTVKLFYMTAAVCAVGGIVAAFGSVVIAVGYLIAGAALVALWSLAGMYRTFYIAFGDGGRLTLNSGVPFRLRKWRYHKVVQKTSLEAVALSPDERLWLYRPMSRPDALEMLVRLLSVHGDVEDAARIAASLPQSMRDMRLGDVPLEGGAS